jgi:hypothetical protein
MTNHGSVVVYGVARTQTKRIAGDKAMKSIARALVLTVGLATLIVAGNVLAQDQGGTTPPPPNAGGGDNGRRGRGNFDPAQFQQRMLDNAKERLGITSDDEWKVIQPLVEKVFQTRRETMTGMRGPRRGGDNGGNGGNNRPAVTPTPNPEAEALQQALDSKAEADVLKTKLAAFRDARKVKEAALTKAQEDLRKVLSVRQEASAVLMGLLP